MQGLDYHFRDVLPLLKEAGRLNVWMCYYLHTNDHNDAWPGLDTLERETGFSRPTLILTKRWLVSHGMLEPFSETRYAYYREKEQQFSSDAYHLPPRIQRCADAACECHHIVPEEGCAILFVAPPEADKDALEKPTQKNKGGKASLPPGGEGGKASLPQGVNSVYQRGKASLPEVYTVSINNEVDSLPATSSDVAGGENLPAEPSKPKRQKSAPTPPDDLFQADPGQYTKASLQAFYADAIARGSLGNDPPDAPRLLAVWLDREREGRARAGVITWLERAAREFWYEHHKAQWSYPDMTGLVAQACGLDLDDPNIVYIVRNLIAGPLWGIPNGYSPDELRAFITYWQTGDWRGKKGQPCQTDQLAVELNKRRAAQKRGKGKGAKADGRAAAQGAALESGTGDAGAGGPDTGSGLDDMPEVMAWFEQQQRREQLEQIKRNLAGAAA